MSLASPRRVGYLLRTFADLGASSGQAVASSGHASQTGNRAAAFGHGCPFYKLHAEENNGGPGRHLLGIPYICTFTP